MNIQMLKLNSKLLIGILVLVIAIFVGGIGWYMLTKTNQNNSEPTTPQYFSGYTGGNNIPSSVDIATNVPGILVAWQDQRVVDGNFDCVIYKSDNHKTIASYSIPGGLTTGNEAPAPKTDYKDSSLSRATIDQLIQGYCGKK